MAWFTWPTMGSWLPQDVDVGISDTKPPEVESALDNAVKSRAAIFQAPPGSAGATITDIGLIQRGSVGAPPNYLIDIETIDSTGFPSGIHYGGGVDTSVAFTTAGFVWYPLTAPQPVIGAVGDVFCARIRAGGIAPDASNNVTISTALSTNQENYTCPYDAYFDTAWHGSATTDIPNVGIRLNGATVIWPGSYTTLTKVAFASPLGKGARFTLPLAGGSCLGAYMHLGLLNGPWTYKLYDGTTLVAATPTLANNLVVNPTTQWHMVAGLWAGGAVALARGRTYRLIAVPTSAFTISIAHLASIDAGSHDAIVTEGEFTNDLTEYDGTNFVDTALNHALGALLIMESFGP